MNAETCLVCAKVDNASTFLGRTCVNVILDTSLMKKAKFVKVINFWTWWSLFTNYYRLPKGLYGIN